MVIKFMIRMGKFLYGSDTWYILQVTMFYSFVKLFKQSVRL
jgi:hypothetical protein